MKQQVMEKLLVRFEDMISEFNNPESLLTESDIVKNLQALSVKSKILRRGSPTNAAVMKEIMNS